MHQHVIGLAVMLSCVAASAEPAAALELTAAQKATKATLASAGCIMLQVSREYDPARDKAEAAAAAEHSCDAEAVAVGKARAAAGLDKAAPLTDDQSRLAARQMAALFIEQLSAGTPPR